MERVGKYVVVMAKKSAVEKIKKLFTSPAPDHLAENILTFALSMLVLS
jgi:hypothetical protein